MTTWHTRVLLRIDDGWSIPQQGFATLKRGEIGILSSGPTVIVKIGAYNGQPWDEAIPLYIGSLPNGVPLAVVVPDGSGLPDGALLAWDGTAFVADVEGIEFYSSSTGPLTYTASGDSWGVGSGVVPTTLDGGTFNDDFVPPSFTSTITIGAPTA